jgi:hypothetical protein
MSGGPQGTKATKTATTMKGRRCTHTMVTMVKDITEFMEVKLGAAMAADTRAEIEKSAATKEE